MAKVLKVTPTKISIGMDDGTLQDFDPSKFDFMPTVGMAVDVFKNDSDLVILPAKQEITGEHLVNKTTYLLLAFFLGGIGAHKFYAKRTGLGILYLLFFWTFIPAVVALVDICIAVGKNKDDNGNILA